MKLQTSKWGNSLAMRIPAQLARRFGLRNSDSVQARFAVDGAPGIGPANWSRRDFGFELQAARFALAVGHSVMDELRRKARHSAAFTTLY